MDAQLVELDDRRRVSLGKIGKAEHRRYLVTEEPDGTLVLHPAAVISEAQLRLLKDPELMQRVDDAMAGRVEWVRRGRPKRKD